MRFSLIFTSLVFLSSCGHSLKQAESFSDKMDRYQAHQYSNNKVPSIELPKNIQIGSSSRAPASIAPKEKKSLVMSNKRLYFLTLYTQYKTLNKMVKDEAPELNICPSFHTNLIQEKKSKMLNTDIATVDFSKINYSDDEFNPELYLPITRNSTLPIVKDVVSQEGHSAVEKALEVHLNKTYSELQELCEFGNSDNYYTFENLYTLIQRGKVHYRNDKISALMKTTLFTNQILIRSLKSRTQRIGRYPAQVISSSENNFMSEVYKRFKSPIKDKQLDLVYARRK